MKKGRILTGLLAAASVFALAFTTPQPTKAASNPSGVSAIKKRGTIKVAVFGDLPPYGWVNKDGKRTGYDIALAKQIGKDLNTKVKFVQVNADSRVDALKSNKVDIVLANFTVTPERKQVVAFAKPYMKVSVGVVSPKKKVITKVNQLDGKNLIVTKGTTAESYFTQKQPKVQLQKYDSKTQQFNALKNGRAVALADDNSYLYAWVKNHPNYKVGIKHLGPNQYIAPGIKKGNTSLLNWTNKEINKLNKNGFFKTDYNQNLKPYFGSDVSAKDIIITK
ncbi:transporter substrate-binding domain-containing protein [Loigolactobacillus backii]|uniref:transporter substrate-binding domain-containing protein n=1 Tax=Loigolactobacillus backii TaxID=375175 RepID=UPI0007F156FF|nr:transporter substrate-binding domain-containing protein [Loigolactobacillus backii]ANK60356.1 ABC transporter substrate-binding protein [Loigolactobacillus backii]